MGGETARHAVRRALSTLTSSGRTGKRVGGTVARAFRGDLAAHAFHRVLRSKAALWWAEGCPVAPGCRAARFPPGASF